MSSFATFALVPEKVLPALVEAAGGTHDDYAEWLRSNAGASVPFPWSGIVLVTALTYLEEKHGIDLMKSEHDAVAAELSVMGGTHLILTTAHRAEYFERLLAESFSEDELRDYFNAFHECEEADVGRPVKDGIRALREVLGQVSEGQVVLLTIA